MSVPPARAFGWGRTLRGAGFLLGAQGGRLLLQLAQLVLIARFLGPEGLGSVAVVLAIANIIKPLAGCGTSVLVVEEVSRDAGRRAILLRRAPWIHLAGGIALGLPAGLLVVPLLHLTIPVGFAVLLLLAEVVLGGLYGFLAGSWQAEERFGAQARWLLSVPAVRVGLLGGAALLGRLDMVSFCWIYAGGLLAVVSLGYALRLSGAGPAAPSDGWVDGLRRGARYALGLTGLSLLPEVEKILLPRLADVATAGRYVAGIRAVNFATLPLGSLLAAILPRFFRDGLEGAVAAARVAVQAGKATVLYAVAIGAVLFALADLAVPLLGEEYALAPTIIRAGVGLLLLQAIHLPAGDALTGAGHAGFRAVAQVAAAGLVALVAWAAIPPLGWKGALLGTYAGHAFLLVLLAGRLALLARSAPAQTSRPGSGSAR